MGKEPIRMIKSETPVKASPGVEQLFEQEFIINPDKSETLVRQKYVTEQESGDPIIREVYLTPKTPTDIFLTSDPTVDARYSSAKRIIPSEERLQFVPPPTPIVSPPTPIEPEEVAEVEYQPEEPVFVAPPAPVEPEPAPEEEDELADLFEVPQPEDNDMRIDHLLARPEEEGEDDLSDLIEVSHEDIMGDGFEDEPYPGTPATEELPRRVPTRRTRKPSRRYQPPPTSLGGVRS